MFIIIAFDSVLARSSPIFKQDLSVLSQGIEFHCTFYRGNVSLLLFPWASV